MARNNSSCDPPPVIAYEESQSPILLAYDTWIFRPHFIAIQRVQRPDADANELQATFELVGHFLEKKPQLEEEAVLCFRRGDWIRPRTGKWSARLSVSKDAYIEEAKTVIKLITLLVFVSK